MALRKGKLSLLAAAGLGLAFVSSAAAAAGNMIVVRSAGPSAKAYPPGKTIPSSSKIALRAGDSVTILGSKVARTLRGPGTFVAASSARAELAVAANRRARFGALRSSDYPQNPSPWNLDVSKSGNMCVADAGKLMLWRPYTVDTVEVSIKPASGAAHTLKWAAGEATIAWPAGVPIADGAEYEVQVDGEEPVKLSMATLGGTPGDMVVAAQTLIERGCEHQVEVLVEGLDKADQ